MAKQVIVITDTFGEAFTKQNENNTELYNIRDELELITSERFPYQSSSGYADSPLYYDEANDKIVSDVTFEVPGGTIAIGETVDLSSSSGDLIVSDQVKEKNKYVITSEFDSTGASSPNFLKLGAESVLNVQTDFSQTLTANPLTWSITGTVVSPATRQVNTSTFKTGGAMTNVRAKFTDNSTGLVLRYIPDKATWEAGIGGLSLISGDNIFDFVNTDDTNPTSPAGYFNLGVNPFEIENGQQIDLELQADVVNILGESGGQPYQLADIQDGTRDNIVVGDSNGNVSVSGDVSVAGDVEVGGTITSTSMENLLVTDNHILLNNGYLTETELMGGIIINRLPTSTKDTATALAFVAGIAAISNPTLGTDTASVFSQDDIIMINGSAENDGVYEVESHAANLLTVKGIGTVPTTEGLFNTQFTANASDTCTITKITITSLCTDDDGVWRVSDGAITPLTWTDLVFGTIGSDKEVLFNDGGVTGSEAGFEYDKVTNSLTIAGGVTSTTGVINAYGPGGDATNFVAGLGAGASLTTGAINNIIGSLAGKNITEGNGNITIGRSAGDQLTTEDNNTFIGSLAGFAVTGSNNSIAIGPNSLSNSSSTDIIAIGNGTGGTSSSNDSIFIGEGAGVGETANEKLFISNVTKDLIEGSFADDWIKLNGSVETTDNIHINKTLGRIELGLQDSTGDVHVGASGDGSAPPAGGLDYGFFTAYNAYRSDGSGAETQGEWYHSRDTINEAYRFGAGIHQNSFNWDYSTTTAANPLVFDNLMKLEKGGNLGLGVDPNARLHVYENTTETGAAAGLTIEQGGTGDAVIHYTRTGIQTFSTGVDGTDSDKFKIVSGDELGANPLLTIDNVGAVEITESIATPTGGLGTLQNRLKYSQDFSNAAWFKVSTYPPTVVANNAIAPDGTMKADTVTFPGPGSGFIRQYGLGTTVGNTYTVSGWVRLVSGTAVFRVDINGGSNALVIAETSWRRFSNVLVAGASSNLLDLGLTGAAVYEFWGWQVNDGTDTYPYLKTEATSLQIATTGGVINNNLIVDGSPVTTEADLLNGGTGVIEGGDLSINGGDNTLLDITAGSFKIYDYTNPEIPYIKTISWGAQSLSPTLSTSWNKWLGVKESATPGVAEFVFDPEFTQSEKRTHAIVGRCWGAGGSDVIIGVGQYTTPAFGQAKIGEDLSFTLGSFNKEGNTYAFNGSNLLLNKSAGKSYRFSAGWGTDPTSPNTHIDASQSGISSYYYHLQNATSSDIQTDIDPDNYDNGGTKTSVPTGKYTLQRLYYYPVSQVCAVTYGQELYDSMVAAIGAAGEDEISLQTELIDGAILRGWVALKQGATDLSDPSQALFKQAQSLNEPRALGAVGTNFANRSYYISDYGASDLNYMCGFYESDATEALLTIGGTVTQVFGGTNRATAAHAFIVSGGLIGGVGLTLTVSGTSITDLGVRTTGDSEILTTAMESVPLNTYIETDKKWLGVVTYTLTGTSGTISFNYGFAKYEDFGNRMFTVTDVEFTGKAGANASSTNVELLPHISTGWTFNSTNFVPGSSPIVDMVTDYVTETDIDDESYFNYERANLSYMIDGSASEGVVIRFTQTTNNAIRYGTAQLGVLI